MIPDLDLARIRRWVEARNEDIPEEARAFIRYEIDVTGRSVTIVECRPPWQPEDGPEWTRFPVARLRHTKKTGKWSIYRRDRNANFHLYDLVAPTSHVDRLLAEIERDPTAIFWG